MGIFLGFHNLLRWLIFFAALFTFFRLIKGLIRKASWSNTDRVSWLVFTILLDIQLLLGLILFFLFSPYVKIFFSNITASIQNPALRFWGIIHIGLMCTAVAFGHLGSTAGKKMIPDQEKFMRSLVFFSLTLIFLILGTPWSRPILPSF